MGIITYLTGDVLSLFENNRFDVLIHSCNCFHTMGGGVAKAIKNRYPQVYQADQNTEYGSKDKLGSFSIGYTKFGEVLNLYTQYYYGSLCNGPCVDYKALEQCLRKVGDAYSDRRIGMPMISCGLAQGEWNIIYPMIEKYINQPIVARL
jgi:O-acetyl-ADP-ribose deacetylase (regulator of RNase III)